MLEIIVVNEDDEPVTLSGLRLLDDRFTERAPISRPVVFEPGERTDVQVAFGPARCDVAVRASSSEVAFTVRRPTVRADVRLALPASSDVLQRLHEERCFAETAASVVDLRFGEVWQQTDSAVTARGQILLDRVSGSSERVTVDEIDGSVIFSVDVKGRQDQPAAVLEPDQAAAAIPIRISAVRCEPHAVADSKKTFTFPLYVSWAMTRPATWR
ncbi:MAG: hypothetical protein ACR2MA_08770 [Egibacteraceae bacterium]